MVKSAHWLFFTVLVLILAACDSGVPGTSNNSTSSNKFIGDFKPNVSCDNPLVINSDVIADLTLNSGCYLVTAPIVVRNNAKLEIFPDSILVFRTGTGIIVDGGNIIANGTKQKPIYFTGDVEIPGAWVGIKIEDRNLSPHSLSNVVIEYAGGDNYYNGNAAFAVIHQNGQDIFSKGKITFNDNVIRNSGSKYAFFANTLSNLEPLQNNTFYKNIKYPIHITPDDIKLITESNRFEYKNDSNSVNKIYIADTHLGNFEGIDNQETPVVTWKNLGIPYLIQNGIAVNNTHFIIEAGTELQFATNADLVLAANSSIALEGTIDAPITLTGEDKQPGSWAGMQIHGSQSLKNKIIYTNVEYGGNLQSQTNKAAIQLKNGAQLNISNSIISYSAGYGILAESESRLVFKNNTITQNAVAGRIYSDVIKFLDTASDYSGNLGDYFQIISVPVSTSESWPGINIPYRFYNHISVSNALTIEPGATLLFEENTWLDVSGDTSSLTAIGEPQNQITFSSSSQLDENSALHYWRGLIFRNSHGNDQNVLENVQINYSGYTGNGSTGLEYGAAAIRISTDPSKLRTSRLKINSISISNLDINSWGIYVDQRSTLIQESASNNSIEGGICKEGSLDC